MGKMINITKFWNDKILKQKGKLFPDGIGHQNGEFEMLFFIFMLLLANYYNEI